MEQEYFGVSLEKLLTSGGQTLYMVAWSLIIGTIIGIILALILVLCRKGGLIENLILYNIVSIYINIVRSIPFVILLVAIMPLTRAIVGTTIGSTASLVPLVIYISPYLARLMENSLLEINPGILEAAEAMGASTWQTIRYFLLPETLGSIVLALTTGTIGLLGASAMAGYVGGGGGGGGGSLSINPHLAVKRIREAAAILSEGADLIQDRTIYEDAYIFASNLHGLGLMSSRDFDTYMKIFDLATGLIRKPDLLIYLKASVPTLVKQIKKRGRAYEASIQEGYLEQLNRKYEEWINNIYQGEVMTIDVDTVNFIENPSLLDGVVARIAEFKTRGR